MFLFRVLTVHAETDRNRSTPSNPGIPRTGALGPSSHSTFDRALPLDSVFVSNGLCARAATLSLAHPSPFLPSYWTPLLCLNLSDVPCPATLLPSITRSLYRPHLSNFAPFMQLIYACCYCSCPLPCNPPRAPSPLFPLRRVSFHPRPSPILLICSVFPRFYDSSFPPLVSSRLSCVLVVRMCLYDISIDIVCYLAPSHRFSSSLPKWVNYRSA